MRINSIIKCLAVRHLFFLVLISFLWILNLALKSVAEPANWSSHLLQEITLTTFGLLHDKLPLTLSTVPVTLH